MQQSFVTTTVLLALVFGTGLSGCISIPRPGVPVFKDKSGVTWLAASDQLAMNGCATARNEYDREACRAPIAESSPAQRICEKFGARLPSEKEIEGLVKTFEHDAQKMKLTPNGLKQIEAAFGTDDWSDAIWTSTLGKRDSEIAVTWNPKFGKGYENRYVRRAVRCVR